MTVSLTPRQHLLKYATFRKRLGDGHFYLISWYLAFGEQVVKNCLFVFVFVVCCSSVEFMNASFAHHQIQAIEGHILLVAAVKARAPDVCAIFSHQWLGGDKRKTQRQWSLASGLCGGLQFVPRCALTLCLEFLKLCKLVFVKGKWGDGPFYFLSLCWALPENEGSGEVLATVNTHKTIKNCWF